MVVAISASKTAACSCTARSQSTARCQKRFIACCVANPQAKKNIDSPTSRSATAAGGSSRREVLLSSFVAPPLLAIGSDDPTTILNSVLSGYGLPTLKPSAGFKPYDEFADDFVFEYPRSWVARPNSLRQGVYISDFQTADKVAVEVIELPADGNIQAAAVAAAVVPGGPGGQDDRINLPAQRLIKSSQEEVDGQEYLYLEFPSETITRSGYQIKRKNFAAAAVKHGKLYTIAASARSDQYDETKKGVLQHVVHSFRLR